MPAAGALLNARCCSAFKCPVSVKALNFVLIRKEHSVAYYNVRFENM
jgi:hypothetical protein